MSRVRVPLAALLAPLALALLIAAPARAEKRVALVVGNSTYKEVGKLANPVNDAKGNAEVLLKMRDKGLKIKLK